MQNTLAPIALFVFNRPGHTRRTVEALQNNELASKSDLFIFSDGPRNHNDHEGVRAVREYIRTIRGFGKIAVIEREQNMGLAQSIISGVTDIVNRYGTVIVLEDDLVTSRYFLEYMNENLKLYENESRVMHISGFRYPIGDYSASDTFFLRLPLCWGWGTWKRAWSLFQKNNAVISRFDKSMISRFDFDGTYPYWKQLELNQSSRISSWFVYWYATVFLQNGLCLFPKTSMVLNIGHDGSGVHCGITGDYNVQLAVSPIQMERISLEESYEAFVRHKEYFQGLSSPAFHLRFQRKIWNVAKRFFHDD